jgi:hypothetical protein
LFSIRSRGDATLVEFELTLAALLKTLPLRPLPPKMPRLLGESAHSTVMSAWSERGDWARSKLQKSSVAFNGVHSLRPQQLKTVSRQTKWLGRVRRHQGACEKSRRQVWLQITAQLQSDRFEFHVPYSLVVCGRYTRSCSGFLRQGWGRSSSS